MAVRFLTHNISFNLRDRSSTRNWIRDCIAEEGKLPGDITFVFVNDRFLLGLNKKFLGHHYLTDVITFDYTLPVNLSEKQKTGKNRGAPGVINGDIFISIDRVRENSGHYQSSFVEELNRVMIHGVLHLCGISDKSIVKREEMRKMENYYLKRL